ncbi:hypothetical protein C0995_010103 [Termitomyces sp. Mi166|nr:hypothetical protein C0995_010103 [Termitomyces sp. Mi166\
MAPSALVLIADGTEEMEFTITYDTLVRAGVVTKSAFVPENEGPRTQSPPFAKGSRGINIMPDSYLDNKDFGPDKYDLLVIPGGAKGADTMSKSPTVQKLIRDYLNANKVVGFDYSEDSVVVSGNLITSRGPGTAFPFAFTLVEQLCGAEKRAEVFKPMIFPPGTPF